MELRKTNVKQLLTAVFSELKSKGKEAKEMTAGELVGVKGAFLEHGETKACLYFERSMPEDNEK